MRTLAIWISISAFLHCACSNKPTTTESAIIRKGVTEICINPPYDNLLQMDSIFSSIEAIKLETNKQCLISNHRKILFDNNQIFISNETNNLFVFSDKGEFIREISKKGRGPEEFFELRDFQIDFEGNIHILDYLRVLVYTNDGKLIETIKFEAPDNSVVLNPLAFSLSEKKGEYYLWGGSFGIESNVNNNHFALYRIDKSGNFTERYFPVKHSIMGNGNRFRFFDNFTNITPVFGNDTIYSIDNGELKSRYYVNFGDRSLKEKIPDNFSSLGEFKSRLNSKYVTGIYDFIETSNWCYMTFPFNGLVYKAYYSKKSENVFVSLSNPRLPNRIAPLWIDTNFDDKLIAMKSAGFIVREIERLMTDTSKLSEEEKHFIQSLLDVKDTDNPVLLVCEMKE
ncbi:6-bladed beta-propeller [Geofilum rubicundum]|nr:6-bladed beta-propeller [Geofilum rubicundum]